MERPVAKSIESYRALRFARCSRLVALNSKANQHMPLLEEMIGRYSLASTLSETHRQAGGSTTQFGTRGRPSILDESG